jgi:hypothetical protein
METKLYIMWCNSFDEHYDTHDRACELLKCPKKDMEVVVNDYLPHFHMFYKCKPPS